MTSRSRPPAPSSTLVTGLGAAVDMLVRDHRGAMFCPHHERATIRPLLDFWFYSFSANPEAISHARRYEARVTFRSGCATIAVVASDVPPANRLAFEVFWT